MPHSKAYKRIVAAEKRAKTGAKAASTRPASIGVTLAQRDRIYAAARAHGYNVQLGPRSELGAFIEHMISLAEAETPTTHRTDEVIRLTPKGEALFSEPENADEEGGDFGADYGDENHREPFGVN